MDHLKMHTPNLVDSNIEKIAALFPNVVTEVLKDGKETKAIDFDLLRQELSDTVVEGPQERYQFTWPNKRQSVLTANAPISKTLRPCREESVNFDSTENLYIEGDNLEALKLLQETYLGKVKMIYIDPPYNTGHDFVYEDDFAESVSDYLDDSGQFDEAGNRLVANLESNGRFHTDWLNMMYPRLKLAKNLLSEDGVIFISIDDNEQENLKKICDEIFGESNFVNQFAWVNNLTGRQISGQGAAKTWESILLYAKNKDYAESLIVDINYAKKYMSNSYKGFNRDIRSDHKGNYSVGDTLYNHNRKFNEETRRNLVFSIFFNPITEDITTGEIGQEIKDYIELKPHSNGDGIHKYHAWRWSKEKIHKEKDDLIVLPTSKNGYEIYTKIRDYNNTTLKDVITNISNGEDEVKKLFDGKKYFDYPKSVALLYTLAYSLNDKDALILDFFSGSATTAHAVMQLNAEDGGHRKFIMVQLPEVCDEKSEAYKAGYKNICEIGKERIRRAGRKILDEKPPKNLEIASPERGGGPRNAVEGYNLQAQMSILPAELSPHQSAQALTASPNGGSQSSAHFENGGLDVGFRVLKIDSSNMKDVYYKPSETVQQTLLGLADNIKADRTAEDLLFQVMLDLGVDLSAKIEREEIDGKQVFMVDGNYLIACFDSNVTDATVKAIAEKQPYFAVFRDSGFATDSTAANCEQLFNTYSPATIRKVM